MGRTILWCLTTMSNKLQLIVCVCWSVGLAVRLYVFINISTHVQTVFYCLKLSSTSTANCFLMFHLKVENYTSVLKKKGNPDRKTFAMWKIARIGRGNTKKRGNKKSGESITPICYNVMNMYSYSVDASLASLSQLPGPSMHLRRPVSMHPPHHPVYYIY